MAFTCSDRTSLVLSEAESVTSAANSSKAEPWHTLARQAGDRCDWLQDADLVVCSHHRDERGVRP